MVKCLSSVSVLVAFAVVIACAPRPGTSMRASAPTSFVNVKSDCSAVITNGVYIVSRGLGLLRSSEDSGVRVLVTP